MDNTQNNANVVVTDTVDCLVAYAYGEYQTSVSNVKVNFEKYPPSYIDIIQLQNTLEDTKELQNVKVFNIIPLSKPTPDMIEAHKEYIKNRKNNK